MRWDTKASYERLHARLKRISAIKNWQLFVLLILGVLLSAIFLRLNNLGMIDLRNAVIAADDKGDSAEIAKAVNELQKYVTSHMNTDLGGGFYLASSYERAREAAINAAADKSNPNSAVYQQASIQCQPAGERAKYGGYVACVQAKVDAVGGQANPASALKLPSSDAYKINFASPLWSFDLAGFFVALSLLIIVVMAFRITGVLILKLLLRRHYSHVL